MIRTDFLVMGGGIAGLSAAARLARHGRVTVLEGEEALGYHSSGRSVAFSHFGIGNETVRGLTAYSRSFFTSPPEGFCPSSLCWAAASLYVASNETLGSLRALEAGMARYSNEISRVSEAELVALCPILRTGAGALICGVIDRSGLQLDSDALLQSYARAVRASGGEVLTGRRIDSVARRGPDWLVRSAGDEWSAPVVINAAGAWADRLAELAGVAPLGLEPKRRTIIAIDPPLDCEVGNWPFVHSAAGDFYMLPDSGRLLASPVDEIASDPCDAQPEEYDVALAADRLQYYTSLSVSRISHRWAGLRSFVSDRVPTAGFAPDAPGFFWLAGQGGYGLQTAPAMAEIVEAVVTGREWPSGLAALGITRRDIDPQRLFTAKN